MPEAYIVDAVRTPVGRRGGGFAATHPADLGAHVIQVLTARGDFDPAAVGVRQRVGGMVDARRQAVAEQREDVGDLGL